MIASFTNDFIFIKTRKTGGTSAEIVLSTWCREPDVCTPIIDDDEKTRAAFGGLAPQKSFGGHSVSNHMPASEIRDVFPDLWAGAFKFTIERHPYEKAVSRVYWNIGRRGGDHVAEFEAELAEVLNSAAFIDRSLYMIDGQIAVDEVIQHQHLWERLACLADGLGYSLPHVLPRAKAEHRKDRRCAKEILTGPQKSAIRDIAAFEFDAFGFHP